MNFIKALKTIGLLIGGAVFAIVFNYFFLERILIPDPCYYHNKDTTALFDLFYDLPISENGHPFPTVFNFAITLILGAILGLFSGKYLNRKFSIGSKADC